MTKPAWDAYLDSWGDSTVKAPYGVPCARLEGGSYAGTATGTINTWKMPQFPETFHAGNRRYVVGEELGGVDIFIDFLLLIKPNETPSLCGGGNDQVYS